jgi:OmpA-OmpF porin, OOP family
VNGTFDWKKNPTPQSSRRSMPSSDKIGTWVIISLLTAIIIHLLLFIALGHLKITISPKAIEEIITEQIHVRPVDDDYELSPASDTPVKQPEIDQSKLVDELDVLEKIKDPELEIKPNIEEAVYDIDIKMETSSIAGDVEGDTTKAIEEISIPDVDLQSLGKMNTPMLESSLGQMTVDPGSDMEKTDELASYMDGLIKKGNQGNRLEGLPKGASSLDEMIGMTEKVLISATTLLPSDLLFKFNKASLQSGSKVGLQKVALLIDRNPNLYCLIDGYTDLIGDDESNFALSLRRAEAVKNYLINTMGMNPQKIITRGLGKKSPIVIQGTQEQQSINRRVEIKMRRKPSSNDQPVKVAPARAEIISEENLPEMPTESSTENEVPPKANPVKVKPKRALPVNEEESAPKAEAITEDEESKPQTSDSITTEAVEEEKLQAKPVEE